MCEHSGTPLKAPPPSSLFIYSQPSMTHSCKSSRLRSCSWWGSLRCTVIAWATLPERTHFALGVCPEYTCVAALVIVCLDEPHSVMSLMLVYRLLY